MLPFTTYTLPEPPGNRTPSKGKWLLFISDQAFSMSQIELIQKMGAALKADFEKDTFSFILQTQRDHDVLSSSTRLIISFGILPASIGLWIDLQTPGIRFLESFSFILTLPIAEVEKNAAAKKELWKNMQMFMEMNEKQNE
jgi:hypothetical protein